MPGPSVMIDDSSLDTLLDLACRLADAAGAAALPHFRKPGLDTGNKAGGGGFDPVTEADRAAEAAMRAILTAERPDDGILGEEEARTEGRSGLTWVLDPIDGTRAFIAGLPTWGVLIALDDGAAGRIGVIDQPHVGERFVGVNRTDAIAAWIEKAGQRSSLKARPCAGIEDALMLTTAPEIFAPGEREAFEMVRARTRLTRYGTDSYGYAMVAAGQADLVIESGLEAYDIAAPAAVVRAAGGIVTDWKGGDPRWGGRVIAAGDARTHEAALQILASVA